MELDGGGETGCHAHATCIPVGLIISTEWAEGAPWPSDPTTIELRSQGEPLLATCAANVAGVVDCEIWCAEDRTTRCTVPLTESVDDPELGPSIRRELELGVEVDGGGPVFDLVLHEWFQSAERHAWPRDLEIAFSGLGAEYLWVFDPPNVNLSAGADIDDCYVELCDARLQRVIVSRLGPT